MFYIAHPISTFFMSIVTGIVAGLVNSIGGGGGGLIATPVLLMLGLPPAVALGTNRLQGLVGDATSTFYYLRHKHLSLKDLKLGLCVVVIAAALGTFCVNHLHPEHLRLIITILLIVVFIYIAIPQKHKEHRQPRLKPTLFYLIFGFAIGFYNGFFGPNTGSFWVIAGISFLAMDIPEAIIHGKPLNTIGTGTSFLIFAFYGKISYFLGLSMAFGQIIGSSYGSRFVVSQHKHLIRPIFLTIIGLLVLQNLITQWPHIIAFTQHLTNG